MKKIVTIFLLVQIISNNTFAEQLIKVPGLVKHYIHHAKQHADNTDFYAFLRNHYSGDDDKNIHSQNKHAEDKDCNLPFKHCGNCCINLHVSIFGFIASDLNVEAVVFHFEKNTFPLLDDRIDSLDLSSIWQPPKIS